LEDKKCFNGNSTTDPIAVLFDDVCFASLVLLGRLSASSRFFSVDELVLKISFGSFDLLAERASSLSLNQSRRVLAGVFFDELQLSAETESGGGFLGEDVGAFSSSRHCAREVKRFVVAFAFASAFALFVACRIALFSNPFL